jgi:deoxyribodipyrimidine photo-lyase
MSKKALFWFRRDLRLNDNTGLYHALKNNEQVQAIFIFDPSILDRLEDEDDVRVTFLHREVTRINEELQKIGSSLDVYYDTPQNVFTSLAQAGEISAVYTNHDYEPYAQERDSQINELLKKHNIAFHTFKDQVVFEKDEVMKDDGKPYTVFTPYSRKWKLKLSENDIQSYPSETLSNSFVRREKSELPNLKDMGFIPSRISIPSNILLVDIVKRYANHRDFPAQKGTSKLSVHLRFGTVSIRELVREARGLSETWLNELIWREFYQMILWNFPQVVHKAFKPAYDLIDWRNDSDSFNRWCEGKTGYPIVDAGMRELLATGFMHNRVRMIVASFLTKHLLIDWRWGEAWFARKLMDFELASNNGGWQWAAGCGCDAAPYFRVFSPALQTEKFDPQAEYIRRWIPEINDPFAYPKPIVDHKLARERALSTYKAGLQKSDSSSV